MQIVSVWLLVMGVGVNMPPSIHPPMFADKASCQLAYTHINKSAQDNRYTPKMACIKVNVVVVNK